MRSLKRNMWIGLIYFEVSTLCLIPLSQIVRRHIFAAQHMHITVSDRTPSQTQSISSFARLITTTTSVESFSNLDVSISTAKTSRHISFSNYMKITQKENPTRAWKVWISEKGKE